MRSLRETMAADILIRYDRLEGDGRYALLFAFDYTKDKLELESGDFTVWRDEEKVAVAQQGWRFEGAIVERADRAGARAINIKPHNRGAGVVRCRNPCRVRSVVLRDSHQGGFKDGLESGRRKLEAGQRQS